MSVQLRSVPAVLKPAALQSSLQTVSSTRALTMSKKTSENKSANPMKGEGMQNVLQEAGVALGTGPPWYQRLARKATRATITIAKD